MSDNLSDNFVFFWKKDEPNGIFSNWSDHSIEDDGRIFKTLEHYLMYSKACLFEDYKTATEILKADGPLSAKHLGRKVKNFNETVWVANRHIIMQRGLQMKIEQNEDVKEALLATGNKLIAEASPYDMIWGIGMSKDNKYATDQTKWKGENLLGKAWMHVRTYYCY